MNDLLLRLETSQKDCFDRGLHIAAMDIQAARAEIARLRSSPHAQEVKHCGVIEFEYCNWEGRKAIRQARPVSIRFGKSEWHPKPQWLLLAFDIDKEAEREFAMADMAFEDDALAALAIPSASRATPNSPEQDSASAGLQSQSGINRSLSEGTPREGAPSPSAECK